jgi:hypothetical protein
LTTMTLNPRSSSSKKQWRPSSAENGKMPRLQGLFTRDTTQNLVILWKILYVLFNHVHLSSAFLCSLYFPANFLSPHKIVWYSHFDSDRISSTSPKQICPFI